MKKPEKLAKCNTEDYYPNFNCIIKCIKTCFKQNVREGFVFEGEKHPAWEMVYVIEGSVFVLEDDTTYRISEGEVIFHKPMEFHKVWCKNISKAKFKVLSFIADNDILNPLGEKVIKLNIEKKAELEEIFKAIENYFNNSIRVLRKIENPNEIAERITFGKLELFLLSLINSFSYDKLSCYSIGALNYKHILTVMEENLNKNLTIEDLAIICNLSVSNLKKTFGKFNDTGVIKYFNRMKIKNAIQRLRCGDSVATVSHELGFSSPNYFSVVFKRETGILPSEFIKSDLPDW